MVPPKFLFLKKNLPIGGKKNHYAGFLPPVLNPPNDRYCKSTITKVTLKIHRTSHIEFSVFSSLRDTVYFTYVLFSLSHHQPFLSLSYSALWSFYSFYMSFIHARIIACVLPQNEVVWVKVFSLSVAPWPGKN